MGTAILQMKRTINVLVLVLMMLSISMLGCSANYKEQTLAEPDTTGFSTASIPTDSIETSAPEATQNEAQIVQEGNYVFDFSNSICCQGVYPLLETDSTIYYQQVCFSGESSILYSDKSYRSWAPLCFRPDCMHRDSDCQAFTEGDAKGRMWIYGNYIYYAVNSKEKFDCIELWRMCLDGSAHEKVKDCEMKTNSLNNGMDDTYSLIYTWDFHNRFFILSFIAAYSDREGELISSKRSALVYDLDDIAKQPIDLFAYSDALNEGWYLILAGCGETLYYNLISDPQMLVGQNLVTGKITETVSLPAVPGTCCVLNGDKLIFSTGGSADDSAKVERLYEVDIITGESRLLREANEDEPVYWMHMSKEYIFGTNDTVNEQEQGLFIYDLQGVLLYILPFKEEGVSLWTYYASDEYVFFNAKRINGEFMSGDPLYYMLISDISSGNPNWKLWNVD